MTGNRCNRRGLGGRAAAALLLWPVLALGCSSQDFYGLKDRAPVLVLPTDEDYPDGSGFGRVMALMEMGHRNIVGTATYLAASGGPGTQAEVVRVVREQAVSVEQSAELTRICSTSERGSQTDDCYERAPGAALGYRSAWRGGEHCLAVGMAGLRGTSGRPPAIGFWCAIGARHPPGGGHLLELDQARTVRSMVTVREPDERLFVGTDRGLLVLEGSGETVSEVGWAGAELPEPASRVVALHAHEGPAAGGGFLLALGLPDEQEVLVAEYAPDDPGTPEADPRLVPRACVRVDEPGFGGVVLLSPLEPGGELYLVAAAGRETVERRPVVHLFPLELSADPAEVRCVETAPEQTLGCERPVDDQGREVDFGDDCSVEGSGFGVSFDVGQLDDTDELELVVGCPGARVDGYARAGAAYVFRPLAEGPVPLTALVDASATGWPFEVDREDHRLGDGVLAVPVGPRDEVVLGAPGPRRLRMFLCTGVGRSAPGWDRPHNATGSLVDERCQSLEQ